jgi:hypothetical protein
LNLIRSLPHLYDKVINAMNSVRDGFIDCNNILHVDSIGIDDPFQELLSNQDNLYSKIIIIVEPFYEFIFIFIEVIIKFHNQPF